MRNKVKKINMLILLKYLKVIPLNADIQVRFNCPFHDSKSQVSANINKNNHVWCWGCVKAYDVIEIYKAYTQKNFVTALHELLCFFISKTYHRMLKENQEFLQKEPKKSLFRPQQQKKSLITDIKIANQQFQEHFTKNSDIFNQVRDFYKNQLLSNEKVLKYLLEKRKLSLKIIHDFNLGLANKNNNNLYLWAKKHQKVQQLLSLNLLKEQKKEPCFIHDVFVDCLVIPIEYKNKTTHFYKNNFQYEITPFNPKYKAIKNFNDIPIFYFPYGFSKAWPTIKKTRRIIIHEGFFDVINCHQNNIKNVVGMITITNYLSHQVIKLLKKYQVKIIIGFDNDESGRKNSLRIAQQLKENQLQVNVKNIPLKDCKDADDILKKHNLTTYQQIYT